jgi:hypothetical protein
MGRRGWSEPATFNAPVEDEPVQLILRMNILPALRDFFFHLLSAQKFSTSPLLPTPSYLPPTKSTPLSYLHPPTYHLPTPPPHSIAKAPETSSGCGAGARAARAGPAGVGVGPTHPQKCKMLTFFFCFFCLKKA